MEGAGPLPALFHDRVLMAEPTNIVLPHDQSEGTSNTVSKWFKAVGDAVRKDEPLLEITTDKVTVEIAAPADGTLVEILAAEGVSVEKGQVLGRITAGAKSTSTRTGELVPPGPARAGRTAAPPPPHRSEELAELSPAVRRMIQEHGLDAARITGTGNGGRVTAQDVEAHLAGASAARPPGQPAGRLVPHSAIRKSIAEHMVRSMQTAPHVTAVFEADLSAVIAHRNANKASFEARGVRLTYTAYFVRVTVEAIRALPEANSRWHAEGLEIFEDCSIGIATALEGGGLIVPVLRKAQGLDLLETARRLQDLTGRARDGKLEPRDVQGGTFTISNHGVSGSLLAAPIVINQPQCAILGIGKVEQRASVTPAGGIEPRPKLYVTLTIDHRALDGLQANVFLTRWLETIERWK